MISICYGNLLVASFLINRFYPYRLLLWPTNTIVNSSSFINTYPILLSLRLSPNSQTWQFGWTLLSVVLTILFWIYVLFQYTCSTYFLFFHVFVLAPNRPQYRWIAIVFLTKLFDHSHWPIRFVHPASHKVCHWTTFGFIFFTSHPPYCIPWFPFFHDFIARIIFFSLRDCFPVISWGNITGWLWRQHIWILWSLTFPIWSVLLSQSNTFLVLDLSGFDNMSFPSTRKITIKEGPTHLFSLSFNLSKVQLAYFILLK